MQLCLLTGVIGLSLRNKDQTDLFCFMGLLQSVLPAPCPPSQSFPATRHSGTRISIPRVGDSGGWGCPLSCPVPQRGESLTTLGALLLLIHPSKPSRPERKLSDSSQQGGIRKTAPWPPKGPPSAGVKAKGKQNKPRVLELIILNVNGKGKKKSRSL